MRWPEATFLSAGSVVWHSSVAKGQRPAKRQPGGTARGLGGSPCRRMRSLRPRASGVDHVLKTPDNELDHVMGLAGVAQASHVAQAGVVVRAGG